MEFDVGPNLKLAHSKREVPEEQISLDDALEFLRDHNLGVHLDAKAPGYESELVEAVRRHALHDRSVFSTAYAVTGRRLARIDPSLTRAIGYPRDSYGISRVRWPGGLTRAGAAALRQAMPLRVPLLLRVARANTLALHHALCSRAAVATAHALGAPVVAWTANDPATVGRLAALGVDAIVSDDPEMALATLAAQ